MNRSKLRISLTATLVALALLGTLTACEPQSSLARDRLKDVFGTENLDGLDLDAGIIVTPGEPQTGVGNWAPDPADSTFHPSFDSTWDEEASSTLGGGSSDAFDVPNSAEGITFVDIENGVARFRANLGCEGGRIAETRFYLGNVPDVGIVEAGAPFEGLDSREDAWGQPTFPASTLPVMLALSFPDFKETTNASGDILACVPDEALDLDEIGQAAAAAETLQDVVLTVDGSFANGGCKSRSYRIIPSPTREDDLRANNNTPLFAFQRLDYDDIPDTAFPYSSMSNMGESTEAAS